MKDNDKPVYVVFGATGGIGLEVCRQLATNQNSLVVAARNVEKLQALSDELECPWHPVDATDIHSVEETEAVVRAAKFPPRGTRGYSGNCRAGGWGTLAGADWVEWSDREPMIGVMVEHVSAMDCINEMLAVEDLDFVLFGPADYSMSLGLRKPAKNDEDVQSALKRTIAAARRSGRCKRSNRKYACDHRG